MAAQICCVCGERPGVEAIGGRWFCAEHQAKATYQRKGVWQSGVIAAAGVLVFVALVLLIDVLLKPNLFGTGLIVAGLVLALVPALLWLFAFYTQDRVEPEPVGQVAKLFVIGVALAGAIGVPLTENVFGVSDWLYRSTAATLVGSILIIGVVETFIIYAAVRYFIYDSSEFDERTDGVIYGMAAGLGYATAININFILANDGAQLGGAEVYVAEVALAHAAFGGLLGYFLGRAKLEREPVWWLPGGFALTALLSGLFILLRGQLDKGTITVGTSGSLPSFLGLLLAGVLAIVVTLVVAYLVRRDISEVLAGRGKSPEADAATGDRQANWGVVGLALVLLLLGALLWSGMVNGATSFNKDGFAGSYPSYFTSANREGDVLRVTDALGTGAEFVLRTLPLQGQQDANSVAGLLGGERGTDFDAYKVMDRKQTAVGNRQALRQRWAYVDTGGLSTSAPRLVEGEDYIFMESGRAVVASMLAAPEDTKDVAPLFERFVHSLSY